MEGSESKSLSVTFVLDSSVLQESFEERPLSQVRERVRKRKLPLVSSWVPPTKVRAASCSEIDTNNMHHNMSSQSPMASTSRRHSALPRTPPGSSNPPSATSTPMVTSIPQPSRDSEDAADDLQVLDSTAQPLSLHSLHSLMVKNESKNDKNWEILMAFNSKINDKLDVVSALDSRVSSAEEKLDRALNDIEKLKEAQHSMKNIANDVNDYEIARCSLQMRPAPYAVHDDPDILHEKASEFMRAKLKMRPLTIESLCKFSVTRPAPRGSDNPDENTHLVVRFANRDDRDLVARHSRFLATSRDAACDLVVPDFLYDRWRMLETVAYDLRSKKNLATSVRYQDSNKSLVLYTKSKDGSTPWKIHALPAQRNTLS